MANSFFQFKQFIVNQEKCSMKVCTDSCIFGAYISFYEKDQTNDENNILDIGTGTGLLSLMTAQKVKGNIDAVEIEQNAYEQALENFKNSIWKLRITAFYADITQFKSGKKYDIIISNPPFFDNSLRSSDDRKNAARHNTSLSYAQLASVVFANLTDNGRFYILLPFTQFDTFEKMATDSKLKLQKRTDIKSKESAPYFRTIGIFANAETEDVTTEMLTIKNENNEYTKDFVFLMKDYYLYL